MSLLPNIFFEFAHIPKKNGIVKKKDMGEAEQKKYSNHNKKKLKKILYPLNPLFFALLLSYPSFFYHTYPFTSGSRDVFILSENQSKW